jgi:two-component system, OmpR family, sensor histidine kinase TctE
MPSLKSRLAAWVFLPMLIFSAIDLVVTYRSTDRVATEVQRQLLKGSARIIAEQIAADDGVSAAGAPPAAFELFADKNQDRVFYAVRSATGRLIDGDTALAPPQQAGQGDQEVYFRSRVRGEPVRVVAYAQELRDGGHITVEVAQTMRGHAAFRKRLFLITAREHLILLALVLAGLVVAFRWMLRPLMEFSERVARRKPGSLEQLDADAVPRELLPVIAALNGYVVRLDRTVSAYERFVASTAHHLRTSFAILTSQLNYGMRDERIPPEQKALLAAMQNTTMQGTKVINQLLILASIEQGRQHPARELPPSASALNDIVTSVIEELAPLAQRYDVELGLDAADDGLVLAAPSHLLREITFNLIDNAIKHMDGPGSVSVQVQRVEDRALLRIVDTGPGIAPQHRDRVFERFYRADPAKQNSFGLGLSIVKEICDSLHGDIQLCTSARGRGLQVDVRLPLAADTSAQPQTLAS